MLQIEPFFDIDTSTFSYLVYDLQSRQGAIFDSVLNYEPRSGNIYTASAEQILNRAQELGLKIEWLFETHAHADHLSAAAWLREKTGAKIVIGWQITQVQKYFGTLFNWGETFRTDGHQFDILTKEGDTFTIGESILEVIETPGHTAACVTYLIKQHQQLHAFVGDTLFMPDYGTARCDFPGGSAMQLYDSIHKLYQLPDDTKVYMCHDYPPSDRGHQYVSTVGDEKRKNIQIHEGITREQYVRMREAKDATLAAPVLILPSLQVNITAGELPAPENNGIRYLKIPLNQLPLRVANLKK